MLRPFLTRLAPLAFLVAACASFAPARPEPAPAEKKGPAPPAGKEGPALPLPSGAILAVCDRMADALRLMPKAYVLSPEKYEKLRAMEAELQRLREQLEAPRVVRPSRCVLKGKVEGPLVRLQAQFEFETKRPRAVVTLACGQAMATGVSLDGKVAPLLGGGGPRLPGSEPEDHSVEVDSPGAHQLTLDLLLRLAPRPAGGVGPAFSLDLPRASVTRLDVELPAGAREVRVDNRPLAERPFLSLKGRRLTGDLGPADRLAVSYQGAPPAGGPVQVLSAEGVVSVRVGPRAASSDAQLTLQPLAGQAAQWQLLVPAGSEVKVEPAGTARVAKVDKIPQKNLLLVVVHLKEPSADAVKAFVRAPVPRGAGGRLAAGPFAVLGAARQAGSVLVSNSAPNVHLEFYPRPELARRDVTPAEQKRDPALVAAFRYGLPERPAEARKPGAPPAPWLELEAETVVGQLQTQVSHTLTLAGPAAVEGAPRPAWQVASSVRATPRWADVERLQVRMPPGCEYGEEGTAPPSPAVVRQVAYHKSSRLVEFRLARGSAEPTLKPFAVTVEGSYESAESAKRPGEVAPGAARSAVLRLPRPLGTVEQGGELTVRVPRDVELVSVRPAGVERHSSAGLERVSQNTHEWTWRWSRRAPEGFEVTWRRWQPRVHCAAVVDLHLAAREGRVWRHEMLFQFPQSTPSSVTLRVPAAVGAGLRVLGGGRLLPEEGGRGPGTRTVELSAAAPSAAGQAHRLVLEYSFPLPARGAGGPLAVPLVRPGEGVQGETKVRVWGEPGVLPRRVGEGWVELNVEEVPGANRLPALVLRAEKVDQPLSLALGESPQGTTVLVERALVQAGVDRAGVQTYRARYRLARLAGRSLEVELPAPVPTLELRVALNGKRVDWEAVDESSGERSTGGRVARLRLSPELVGERAVLEVSYQLSPGRTGSDWLHTTLHPPALRGEQGRVPTRWQVTLPAGWVVLGPEGGPGSEQVWGRDGWLLRPRVALSGPDLERWFAGPEGTGTAGGEESSASRPSLVCWREGAGPLTLTHAPRQGWLLACSLGLLALGLGLGWLAWPLEGSSGPAAWAWPVLALLVLAAVVSALLWPSALAAVAYGCEPGAAVLLAVAALQWLLHERYRRRIVFLPSFSRARPGASSVARRAEGSSGARGEPSTVDHPRPGSERGGAGLERSGSTAERGT